MFLCKGDLDYYKDEKIKKLTPAGYAALREAVTSELKKGLPEDHAAFEKMPYMSDTIMDDVEVEAWNRIGVDVKVSTIKGLSRGHARPASDVPQNIFQVSLANVGLLEVNEVTWLEDACTEELQSQLDEGWRILCVCPPKDSRRPTYILGRLDKHRVGRL